MSKSGNRARHALAAVFSFLFFSASICLPLADAASRSSVMEKAFYNYSDTSASGVAESSYTALSRAITLYLSGNAESAQVQIGKFGIPKDAFSQKELLHLHDVRQLIASAIRISLYLASMLAITAIVMIIRFVRLAKQKNNTTIRSCACSGTLTGFYLLFISVLAATIWAIFDFNSLFRFFHTVIFKNDLWLLDPAADLLIQLMPAEFFKYYAVRVLLEWFALDLVLLIPIVICRIKRRKHVL